MRGTTMSSEITTPVRNIPLLRKTLEHIEAHPEEHNQEFWALKTPCGTAFCFAGHAVQLAGYEIDWGSTDFGQPEVHAHYVIAPGAPMAEYRTIAHVAYQELGLTRDEANALFKEYHSLQRLYQLVHEFTDGEIEIPEQFRAS